jgi:hypothetical protein
MPNRSRTEVRDVRPYPYVPQWHYHSGGLVYKIEGGASGFVRISATTGSMMD